MDPQNVSSNVAVLYQANVPMMAEVENNDNVSPNGITDERMEFGSPVSNLKIETNATQTTPGLLRNGPRQPVEEEKKKEESDDEDQCCPICFDSWTNSGDHRLSSLKCGHLFGRSCIARWLKDPKNKCCPQCKAPARKSDIRNIYAKSLKALDTAEREQEKTKLTEEKYKRSRAEEGEARALLEVQIMRIEMEKLKKQCEEAERRLANAASTSTLDERSSQQVCSGFVSASTQLSASSQSSHVYQSQPKKVFAPLEKLYHHKKSFPVAQKDARVMAFDKETMLLVVSKPSPNQLFAGYGILKVSSLVSRSSEFIRIHQNTIRDVKFNQAGDNLVLTASTDKTLKITNVVDSSTVLSYTCPSPVWSCEWNRCDTNYIFAGLQNGSCYLYDIRKLDAELSKIRPRLGVPCPIVSLAYAEPGSADSKFQCEGLLVGTLQGGWFLRKEQDDSYVDHQLILPEGSCTGITFEANNRHCLLSQRPGKKSARSCHSLLELIGDCSQQNPLRATVVRQCYGGNRALSLSRSRLFTCPDDKTRLMMCAGDEASSSVLVWDHGDHGKELQKLPCSGGTIFDVMTFEAYNTNYLAALTEQKLEFFQWQ